MKKTSVILICVVLICLAIFELQPKSWEDGRVVMAFGDSLTYGKGDNVKGEEGYVDGLEYYLNKGGKKPPVQIWNYGIKGQETAGVLKQLNKPEIRTKLKDADEFIVYIGTNNLINSNGGSLVNIHDEAINRARKVYVRDLKEIISILHKENEQAPVTLIGLYNPIPNNQEAEKHIEEWDKEIRKTAKENPGFTYVPTNDLFQDKPKKEYFSDSLHPNQKGYKLITGRILEKNDFR